MANITALCTASLVDVTAPLQRREICADESASVSRALLHHGAQRLHPGRPALDAHGAETTCVRAAATDWHGRRPEL